MKLLKKPVRTERPQKEKVTREQALKRVKAFSNRKEKLIAVIREDQDRDISLGSSQNHLRSADG